VRPDLFGAFSFYGREVPPAAQNLSQANRSVDICDGHSAKTEKHPNPKTQVQTANLGHPAPGFSSFSQRELGPRTAYRLQLRSEEKRQQGCRTPKGPQ
jgi:hypothetical protein